MQQYDWDISRKLAVGVTWESHTESVYGVHVYRDGLSFRPYPLGEWSTPDIQLHGIWDRNVWWPRAWVEVKGWRPDRKEMAGIVQRFRDATRGIAPADMPLLMVVAPRCQKGEEISRRFNRERPVVRVVDLAAGTVTGRWLGHNRTGNMHLVNVTDAKAERPLSQQPFYGKPYVSPLITPAPGRPNATRS